MVTDIGCMKICIPNAMWKNYVTERFIGRFVWLELKIEALKK